MLGIANPIQTFAESSSTQQDINAEINQLEKTYGFETVDLNDSTETINPTELEFDTTEEFEEFVKGLQEEDEVEVNEEISISEDEEYTGRMQTFATTKNGSKLLNWWAPIQNGKIILGSYKNIRIKYKYKYKLVNKKPQFVSVSEYDSYLTGINLEVDWLHKDGKKSFSKKNSTKDTANITVEDIYVLGVIVAGHPIGFKWNGSWKRSLTLKKEK
ncbi:hypothetical protein [Peribacillus sp. TH14]|uniref:hypothetical protein n=1 Tax=Peribacillus sp. TH14 TaxID=2798481 RepID=UPI0019120D77|nr:hypothetical protein [Peribacillus sp. TH14]MBK5499959.1 hypothetical protein [Peribacillus sp. TH14]